MRLWDTLRSGLEAVATHRLRSSLTVLGILIGIAAVILTVGLGEGATASVDSAINGLGTNLLIVTPGSTTTGLVRGGFGSASTLTYANSQALASKVDCPDIAGVAPQVEKSETLVAGTENWTTDVYGSTAAYLSVRDRSMAVGSFFTLPGSRSRRQRRRPRPVDGARARARVACRPDHRHRDRPVHRHRRPQR